MAEVVQYAATTAAGNSSDITVASGASATVYIYPSTNLQDLPETLTCVLQRKIGATSFYQNERDTNGELITLSRSKPSYHITRPGIYRVTKPATTALVGVATYV